MESMYRDYRDIASFRIVYIREAHALGSRRPNHIARENNIKEHRNFAERCTTAQLLMDSNELTIPCLIDSMDNKADADYSAKPDRAFLIGTDGKLIVAGKRGPRGFRPALDEIGDWLASHKASIKTNPVSADQP